MPATAIAESFRTTSNGFSLSSSSGRRDFADSDVVGIRLDTRREADLMGQARVVQSLQLRVSDHEPTDWISVEQEVGDFDRDQLSGFCDRLVDGMVARAWDQLTQGEEIKGEGWSLSLIYFQDHLSGTSCFTQQISRVKWVDDELIVLHEDNMESPIARFSRSAENTMVLYQLLSQMIADSPRVEPIRAGIGLGARLSTIHNHHSHALPMTPRSLLVISILAAILCGMTLYSLSIGIVFIIITLAVGIPLMNGRTESLTQFEQALVWSSGADERVLLNEQLSQLTIDWPDDTSPDLRPKRAARFRFESEQNPASTIEFEIPWNSKQVSVAESLKSRSAALFATRMNQRLDEFGKVNWTPSLRILRDRIECASGDASKSLPLEFSSIGGWELNGGQLTLRTKRGQSPLVVAATEPNFYPGLLLLQMRGVLS